MYVPPVLQKRCLLLVFSLSLEAASRPSVPIAGQCNPIMDCFFGSPVEQRRKQFIATAVMSRGSDILEFTALCPATIIARYIQYCALGKHRPVKLPPCPENNLGPTLD